LAIGLVGYFEPRTLGVGYSNIDDILNVSLPLTVVAMLCTLKFVSWSIALGSGTSGGTLAPLLTFGSGAGLLLGSAASSALPFLQIQPHLAALVGMAALFAGASQALLASVVFACETTGHVQALLPLLGGCSVALMTARLLSKNSIMSEKIARRGVSVPSQYEADVYAHTSVGEVMETDAQLIPGETPASELLARIAAHDPEVCRRQAYLLTDASGNLTGIVTRGDLIKAAESPVLEGPVLSLGNTSLVVTYPDESLHIAIEKLLQHEIGRLPVVRRDMPDRLVGYLSRAAILSARGKAIREEFHRERGWLESRFEETAKPG
jgi:CBS domain-containing protein